MSDEIKITFGIQKNHIERIEELINYWDNTLTPDDYRVLKDGFIKYDRSFWVDLGKEFGWDPFTLALKYFKYKSNEK